MSACWKCGRELPGVELECEDDCIEHLIEERLKDMPHMQPFESAFLDGRIFTRLLVRHVVEGMGAGGMTAVETVNGVQYEVIVRRKA